jgi:hypothetical protein
MSSFLRQLMLLAATISLCACQTFGGQPPRPFDTQAQIKTLASKFDASTISNCKGQECRDDIVLGQVRAIDLVFSEFERDVLKTSEQINVIGDSVIAILGAAGTVTGGESAKSILAAISTSVTGTKGAFDKNVYFQKSAHVLIGRMRALRKEALVPIRTGILQPADKYPLSQALLDVESYFVAGTVPSAVLDIDKGSEDKKTEAEDKVQDMLTLSYGDDDNSTLVRAFWKPNGAVDPLRDKQLREWISTNVLKGLDPATFIDAAAYSEARKRAVAALISSSQPNSSTPNN